MFRRISKLILCPCFNHIRFRPMEGLMHSGSKTLLKRFALLTGIAVCALGVCGLSSVSGAEYYNDPCDSSRTSWEIAQKPPDVELRKHTRDFYEFYSGTAAERLQFAIREGEGSVALSHSVPSSLVHDELTASVWVPVQSHRRGHHPDDPATSSD